MDSQNNIKVNDAMVALFPSTMTMVEHPVQQSPFGQFDPSTEVARKLMPPPPCRVAFMEKNDHSSSQDMAPAASAPFIVGVGGPTADRIFQTNESAKRPRYQYEHTDPRKMLSSTISSSQDFYKHMVERQNLKLWN